MNISSEYIFAIIKSFCKVFKPYEKIFLKVFTKVRAFHHLKIQLWFETFIAGKNLCSNFKASMDSSILKVIQLETPCKFYSSRSENSTMLN